jgi:hypothetical protein
MEKGMNKKDGGLLEASIEKSLSKEERSLLDEINHRLSSARPRTAQKKGNEPHEYDMLFGYGGNIASRPGNLVFRQLCWLYRHEFNRTENVARGGNDNPALAVISHIKRMNPHIRFLAKTGNGAWKDAPQSDIIEYGRCFALSQNPFTTESSESALEKKSDPNAPQRPSYRKKMNPSLGESLSKEDQSLLHELNYILSSAKPRIEQESGNTPHELDIVMMKGSVFMNSPGNLVLRKMCWLCRHQMDKTEITTKNGDNQALATRIISHIKRLNPHVRFLVKAGSGAWKDAPQSDAIEKARILLYRAWKGIIRNPFETESSGRASDSSEGIKARSTKAPETKRDAETANRNTQRPPQCERIAAPSLEESLSKDERSLLNDLNRRLSSAKPRTFHIKGEPHEYDVLMGKKHTNHKGNMAFRQLIWLYKNRLNSSSTREEARCLSFQLVSHMTSLNPTVRFLLGKTNGRWMDASQEEVVDKAIRALERAAKGVTGNPFEAEVASKLPKRAPEKKSANQMAAPIPMPTILHNVLQRPLHANDVIFVAPKAVQYPANKRFRQLVADNSKAFDEAPWYVRLFPSVVSTLLLTLCLGRTSLSFPTELWIK